MAGLQFIGWKQTEREDAVLGTYTLDRRLYLTDNGKVAEEGDTKAAFLLGAAGSEIPMREAVKLGLVDKKAAEKPADKAADKPADKAVRAKENKAQK